MRDVLMILGAGLAVLLVLIALGRRAHRERELSAAALSSSASSDPPTPGPSGGDTPVQQRILALVEQRKKVEAIKLLRNRTGWKLAEAKRYVDGL